MSDEKLGLRFVKQYDVNIDPAPSRLDVFYGVPDLNPWLARWYELLLRPRWLWRRLTQESPLKIYKR